MNGTPMPDARRAGLKRAAGYRKRVYSAARHYFHECVRAAFLDARDSLSPESKSWDDVRYCLVPVVAALEQCVASFKTRKFEREADRRNLTRHYRARLRCLRAALRLEAAARCDKRRAR